MNRLALLIILGCSLSARATTLKELLEAADQHNVDQQISVEQRKLAAAEYGRAWSSLLPLFTAQGTWTRNQYDVVIGTAPGAPDIVITPQDQFDGVLRVDLPLIDAQRWMRTSAAHAGLDAAGFREAQTRDNVTRQVAVTFYGYAASLAVRESARRSLGLAEAQQRLQEVRATAGAVTELEVLRSRAEVQRNKQTVADTEAAVSNLRRALATLTGVQVGDEAQLPKDDLGSEGTLAELEAHTEQVPAVKAAEKDALGAGRNATAAKLAWLPVLSAQASERLTNASGFSGHENSYFAGLALTWRLDGPTYFNMRAQDAVGSVAKLGAERQRLISRDQVHNDYQRLQAAVEKVSAAAAQVEAASLAARLARDRYAAGALTQVDVIQSERDLFTAEVNQIQARTELASSRVSLRLSAGLPLELE